MLTIAALIVEPNERAFVQDQLHGTALPRFCDSADALERLVETGAVQAVLSDLRDRSDTDMLPVLGAMRSRWPSLPLLVCFRPTPAALREVPALVHSIPGMTVVLRGFEHIGLAVKHVCQGPRPSSAAETLLRRLVPVAAEPLQPFITICALKSAPRLRVASAAAWSRIPRRTLERRLTDAKLPGAADIIGLCSALHAAWWLDIQDWPTKRVLEEMRISHSSALTRTFQRHFGCSILELRDHGGFTVMLMRAEQLLRHTPV